MDYLSYYGVGPGGVDMNAQNHMRWSIGGWLGAQLGGSVWLVVAGLRSLYFDTTAGSKVLVLFVIANLVGLALWDKRNQISFYKAIQYLLPVLGVLSLAAVFVLDKARIYEEIQLGGRVSATTTYWLIFGTIVALMAMFYFMFGRKSKDIEP